MKTTYIHFVVGAILGALLITVFGSGSQSTTDEQISSELQAQYYASEVATMVSPHSVRERMSNGDESFILVDVRAKEDYEREHVAGAINIDTSQELPIILNEFKALPDTKEIIMYCYSSACMNGRKAGNFLAGNGVYVKEMTIGWNEWRYGWEMWNYDTEWDEYKVEDYVAEGEEPGEVNTEHGFPKPCPIGGSLSC